MAGIAPGWIERHSGVHERRWADVSGGETATWMGAQAAREALDEAGVAAGDLDLIINASGTPEQALPDGGPLIQRHLGLGGSGIACLSVHTTCLSFFTALDVAGAFLAARRYRRILVVSADVASVGLNIAEHESFSLFGDGAAAAVIVPTPDGEPSAIDALVFSTYGEGADLTAVRGAGTRRHPSAAHARPEDHLFSMQGPSVLRLGMKHAPELLERLRPGLSRGLGDLSLVVPHQTSLAALNALQHFGIPMDRVVVVLDRLGNCVAASLPLALHEAARSGRMRRGDHVLLIGTGAGISLAGALVTY